MEEPPYYAPTAGEGILLIQELVQRLPRLPGARIELVVPRSMPTEEYRELRDAARLLGGDNLVRISDARSEYGYPYYKVIHASRVEDLYAFPYPILENQVVVCISQHIPPALYSEIAKEAERRRFLVACHQQNHPPQNPLPVPANPYTRHRRPGLSPCMKVLKIGGCIMAAGVVLFLSCKSNSKQKHSTPAKLRKPRSSPDNQNTIARACKWVMWKMLAKVLKMVAKDIAIRVLEWAESEG